MRNRKKVEFNNFTMINQYPCAWIVTNNRKDNSLSNDRGRRKIYSGNEIYLDDDQEFQIELFNPTSNSVLAEIKINSNKISNSGLVLRPGERVYLDCFFDTKQKFTFKTYQIDGSIESKKATANNGLVQISFYKEQISFYKEKVLQPAWGNNYPKFDNIFGNVNSTNSFPLVGDSTSVNYSSSSKTSNLLSTNFNKDLKTETTGRIEGGDKSDQTFKQVNIKFEDAILNSITYKLLPEANKPKTIQEFIETKNYCSKCGKRLKGDENYCSSCGTKLK